MYRIQNLSIKTKLSAGFALSLVLIFMIGAISLVQLWGLNALATRVTDVWLPEMEVLADIKRSMEEHQLLALRRTGTTNFRQIAVDSTRRKLAQTSVEDGFRRFEPLAGNFEGRDLLPKLRNGWSNYLASINTAFGKLDSGDPDSAKFEFETVATVDFASSTTIVDELINVAKAQGQSVREDVRSVYWISLSLIVAVLLVSALAVGGAIRWISSNVSLPILRISGAMQRLSAGGNTDVELEGLDRKDEIGVLVNAVSDYRNSLERVRQLAEQDVAGVLIVRTNGTIGYANPYIARLIGYKLDELVGMPFLDLIQNPGKQIVAEKLMRHLSGNDEIVQIEISVRAKDGNIIELLVNASAATFEGGPASIGIMIDISARKRNETALRANEAQLSNALHMARAGHWEYDVASDRFTFNDNFYQLFRTSAEAVGGYVMASADYARRFVHPDEMEIVGAAVQEAIEATDPEYSLEFEHRIIYGDGELGDIAVRIFIVKDAAGRTIKTFGINQDITNRKKGEAALAESRANLQAALANMSQGLCMFDANEKLVVSNFRFAQIYGLSPDKVVPGLTTNDLMALAFHDSKVEDLDLAGTIASKDRFAGNRAGGFLIQHLTDDRSISITHQPMPEGGFLVTFEDITERLVAEKKIQHLAHYDALTGLLNRAAFYEQMGTALARLRRSESVAVLSFDLDRFKSVNDTLGHPIGDLLLQVAAARMRDCVRGEDILARLGGDEFAIVQVSSSHSSDIAALAARTIELLGAPYDLDGHQVVVGVSVGVAIAPTDGVVADVLMKNADLALYRAKADGGGVYRFFEQEMDARMQARRILELDLRKAIVNGEFELYYQPIVDVKTRQITSCEALVRWHHPERGMIAPLDFIPTAEETGLIVPLGEWVLRQACAEAARWPKNITIAVNLSPAQFKSRNLVPTVISALATSGIAASRLELEITELVLLQDNDGAFVVLHQLRGLGIKIAMDDFGTGYSSLGYLRSFPFDKIKIDQSFIRDLPGKEESVAIVRAVVGLSSSLGITTTAEGVETKEQLASLTAEGCTEFQGFFYSQPRSATAVARIIADQVPRETAVA